jgi:hypothetical protein
MIIHELPLDLLIIIFSLFAFLLLKGLLLSDGRKSPHAGHTLRGGFTARR